MSRCQLTWDFTGTLLEHEPPQSQCEDDDEEDEEQGDANRSNWKKKQTNKMEIYISEKSSDEFERGSNVERETVR